MARTKKPGGFTLIELLVVITIIAILAALVLNVAGFIQKKAARARAESEIKALETALESYKVDYGDYPENSAAGSNGSSVLYNALVLSNATSNPSGKVYFEPSKGIVANTNFTNSANFFVDPFGMSYEYRYVAGTNGSNYSGKGFFDLWSFGGNTGQKATMNQTNWVFWVKNW